MFVLDSQHRITWITPSLADWLAIDSTELQNEYITSLVVEEDVLVLQTALAAVQETSEQASRSLSCHLDISNQSIPVEMEFSPISEKSTFGDVIGAMRPDTQTGAHERPESQRIQLRDFIELFDDAAVMFEMLDEEPIVRAVNSAFEDIFGYQSEFVVGESLDDYIVPIEHKDAAKTLNEKLSNGETVTKVVTRRTSTGGQEFSYRGLPINPDNKNQESNVYGLAVYADITEEQRARQHLQVLHRVLRHNLRNELTVILGMAEMVTTEAETSEIREAGERITDRAERLVGVSDKARIAEDILGDPPSDTVVDMGHTAKMVVSEAQEMWPEATITSDIETPLPVATGLEIRDALENLVENAIKHSSDTPTIRLTAHKQTPIHASTRKSGQNVRISIEDNGPGIPEHERAAVFEGKDITQLKHGGGLGLWVVRWIVESADGTISYERDGDWTCINISLPLATNESTVQPP